jgi:hypothetical protein
MPPHVDLFDAPHNQKIKWITCCRPATGRARCGQAGADRPVGEKPEDWPNRKPEPGAHFKYNDVRVNVMVLAALQVWRKLPDAARGSHGLIGASSTWRWYGYVTRGSRSTAGGPVGHGGGHWGGGMFIDSA